MIAYRSQYGSVNPAAIVGPAIVATAVSTLVAVVFCKCITIILNCQTTIKMVLEKNAYGMEKDMI